MKSTLLVLALGFINTAIRSGGDETKDGIFGVDATMCLVTFGTVNTHHIMRYYLRPVVNHECSEHESLVQAQIATGPTWPEISYSSQSVSVLILTVALKRQV